MDIAAACAGAQKAGQSIGPSRSITMDPRDIKALIERYALSPFSRNKGPRMDLIAEDLADAGLEPRVDEAGNVWADKGKGDSPVVISAHMDTVFGLDPKAQRAEFTQKDAGLQVRGTLDNALGCSIAMSAAGIAKPSRKTHFVFTVTEEPGEDDLEEGAEAVISQLQRAGIRPEACVAVDVTFPPDEGSVLPGYAENFTSLELQGSIKHFIKSNGIELIGARGVTTEDESFIYGREFPSFALGPTVFGSLHSDDAWSFVENSAAVADFLIRWLERELP